MMLKSRIHRAMIFSTTGIHLRNIASANTNRRIFQRKCFKLKILWKRLSTIFFDCDHLYASLLYQLKVSFQCNKLWPYTLRDMPSWFFSFFYNTITVAFFIHLATDFFGCVYASHYVLSDKKENRHPRLGFYLSRLTYV